MGSEYGWTKDYTLSSVSYDEFICLTDQIIKRRIDEYIMQLEITTNPHREKDAANHFVTRLLNQRRAAYGMEDEAPALDKARMLALKEKLAGTSKRIQVK